MTPLPRQAHAPNGDAVPLDAHSAPRFAVSDDFRGSACVTLVRGGGGGERRAVDGVRPLVAAPNVILDTS